MSNLTKKAVAVIVLGMFVATSACTKKRFKAAKAEDEKKVTQPVADESDKKAKQGGEQAAEQAAEEILYEIPDPSTPEGLEKIEEELDKSTSQVKEAFFGYMAGIADSSKLYDAIYNNDEFSPEEVREELIVYIEYIKLTSKNIAEDEKLMTILEKELAEQFEADSTNESYISSAVAGGVGVIAIAVGARKYVKSVIGGLERKIKELNKLNSLKRGQNVRDKQKILRKQSLIDETVRTVKNTLDFSIDSIKATNPRQYVAEVLNSGAGLKKPIKLKNIKGLTQTRADRALKQAPVDTFKLKGGSDLAVFRNPQAKNGNDAVVIWKRIMKGGDGKERPHYFKIEMTKNQSTRILSSLREGELSLATINSTGIHRPNIVNNLKGLYVDRSQVVKSAGESMTTRTRNISRINAKISERNTHIAGNSVAIKGLEAKQKLADRLYKWGAAFISIPAAAAGQQGYLALDNPIQIIEYLVGSKESEKEVAEAIEGPVKEEKGQ